ncbi:hypothetical protein BDR07DRAFT_1338043 [Suillus spraguei]|nr:hypothetical protein BDR07DRAFT_1338043 [Suillus spraguei]
MYKSKPTNYLHLFKESEVDRKNLSLHSKNGSIKAEMWLLGAQDAQPFDSKRSTKRTMLNISSDCGSITASVHTIHRVAPFLLTISTKNGGVTVTLPRSFHGLLLLKVRNGSASLSDTLSANCTHLSQVDLTRRYFVGDFSMVDESDWTGDELRVEARHRNIKIKYVEEQTSADDTNKGGLLSRLFGW